MNILDRFFMSDKKLDLILNDKLSEFVKSGGTLKLTDDWWFRNITQPLGINVDDPYNQIYFIKAAVDFLAQSSSQAVLRLYEKKSKKELDETYRIYRLFQRPNEEMCWQELDEFTTTSLCISGNAFWLYLPPVVTQGLLIQPGEENVPSQIIPLPSSIVKVKDRNNFGMVTSYYLNSSDGKEQVFTRDQITNFKNVNLKHPFDPAPSPLTTMTDTMSAFLAAMRWDRRFFENAAIPDLVVSLKDAGPEDVDRVKKDLKKRHKGVDKAHRSMVVANGEIKRLGDTHEEMDFIDSLKELRDMGFILMGTHKALMGVTDQVDRAVAETAQKMVWRNKIRPIIMKRQAKINADFFLRFAPGFFCEYDFSNIEALQENELDQSRIAKELFTAGLATVEQLHKKFPNVVPEPQDYQDLRVMPFNMAPIEVIAEGGTDPTQPSPEDEPAPKPADEKMAKVVNRLASGLEKRMEGRIKNYLFNQRKQIYKIFDEKKEILDYIDEIDFEFKRQDVIMNDSLRIVYNEGYDEAIILAKNVINYTEEVQKDRILIESCLKELNSINLMMKKGIFEILKSSNNQTIDYKESIKKLYEDSDVQVKEVVRKEVKKLLYKTIKLVYDLAGVKE
jgi:phage portal protein BeeE